jgi:FAD:protein FMN transferase
MQQTEFLVVIILVIIIFIVVYFTGRNKKVTIVEEFQLFGTSIQLKLYGKSGKLAMEEAINKLQDINKKMSVFNELSEISMINRKAGVSSQEVSKDTYFVIKKAMEYSELSEGTFDPTIRPIVSLWNIGKDTARVPDKTEIDNILKLVNFKDIILSKKDNNIGLRHKGQAIDVGGIAKGYAADEVKRIFKKYKIKSALINLGGNIVALGKKSDETLWNVGIQNPHDVRGEYVGIISVENKSVVTSGNYERYFTSNGRTYHHIIDPKTGYPSESEIISATIISEKSLDGDGLATGVYIMGLEKSIKLIESLEGIDAIFITENKEIYVTSGIKDKFKITNREFMGLAQNEF